jgi:hypothetical protein
VKEISFNLWHDEGNTDFYSRLSGDGNGMAEVSVEDKGRCTAQ